MLDKLNDSGAANVPLARMTEFVCLKESITYIQMQIDALEVEKNKYSARLAELLHEMREQ